MSLDDESVVRRAQLRSLTKQLPLLYASLCTNALALSWTHMSEAPWWLTALVPAILVPVCIGRAALWLRMETETFDDRTVTYLLHRTIVLVALLGVLFTGWSHSLFQYGDAYSKLHVLFFMSITVVGCIFCLVHLRPAALLLTVIVVAPFLVHFMPLGNTVLLAIGINLLIVSVVMVLMMLAYYDDFRRQVLTTQEVERLSDEHRRAAQTDSLTGLANRRRFFEDIERDIAGDVARGGGPFALGLIDLDGFKLVNDTHGHGAGDDVLDAVSQRLAAGLGPDATVARLGGDEFGILVHGDRLGYLETFGQALCDRLSEPVALPNGTGIVQVGASIGFAVYPAMGRSEGELFERADFALYHAKTSHRGRAVVFSDEHASAIRDRRRIESALQHADLEAELSLSFQPIVDVSARRILGFEALARWTSPVLGRVSPGEFIPTAERLGLVRTITAVLFRKACRAAQAWPADICLSFNLSAHDLFDDDPVGRLTGLVKSGGLPPGRIVFEITETAMMRDFEGGSATLQALRALGCAIALDDFGTGFSSLSYVHRLPLDKLKIDRSFVRSIAQAGTSRAIVQSIYNLSEILGVQCVVEGVETAEEFEVLKAMGLTRMQGYLFGQPLTEFAALAHLAGLPSGDRQLGPPVLGLDQARPRLAVA